jgi:hypothetical protein
MIPTREPRRFREAREQSPIRLLCLHKELLKGSDVENRT